MSKEITKGLVEKKFNELQEFAKLYNTQAQEQRAKLLNEYRDAFKEDPKSIDMVSIAKEMFYLNGFYQADIRKMQVQLLEQYSMAKEIFPEMTFNEDINTTIGVLKTNLPKQIFVVEEGKFQEIEKGKVEELTADFETKGYYKIFEEQIKKVLNA
jgi:hypothetical protein